MIVEVSELIDVVIMTIVVGYIFMDSFVKVGFRVRDAFLFSMASAAPAIILHELGHKMVALAFGFVATFNAAYVWLVIGVVMKLLSGFAFFVPAYVSFSCGIGCVISPLQSVAIAFAGPAVNGLLYVVAHLVTKYYSFADRRVGVIVVATKQLNGLLFIFNLLPIPMFDGFAVVSGLLSVVFG